jgi:hypothetical protein
MTYTWFFASLFMQRSYALFTHHMRPEIKVPLGQGLALFLPLGAVDSLGATLLHLFFASKHH